MTMRDSAPRNMSRMPGYLPTSRHRSKKLPSPLQGVQKEVIISLDGK